MCRHRNRNLPRAMTAVAALAVWWLVVPAMVCADEPEPEAPPAETQPATVVTLQAGETRSITAKGLERIAVGDPSVADVVVISEEEFLVQGQGGGTTSLIAWDADGKREWTVKVTGDKPVQSFEGLRRLLDAEGFSHLSLRQEGGQIYVSGRLMTDQDEERLTRVLDTFPNVVNLVQRALATEYVEPLVELEVRVLEVSEGATTSLGVDWIDQLIVAETPFSSTDTTEPLSHRLADILRIGRLNRSALAFAINHLVSEGYARLLAAPNLVTLSGKEASTFLGGEVPVISEVDVDDGTITQEVEFKKIGTELKMTPTVSKDGSRISTVVEAQLRTLDPTVALTLAVGSGISMTVPGFKVRKTNTEVMCAPGETIVISGLIQNEDSVTHNRVPGASRVPLVGRLFRSKDTEKVKTEILVIFTPTLAKSHAASASAAAPQAAVTTEAREHTMEQAMTQLHVAPAAAASVAGLDVVTAYARQVQEWLAQALDRELRDGQGGIVRLKLRVLPDGSLGDAVIVSSSGAPALDEFVLTAAHERAPYPPFPSSLTEPDVWVEFPIVFQPYPQLGWATPASP